MPISSVRPNENVIPRAYFHCDAHTFICASEAEIYHDLVHNSLQFDLTAQQEMAWTEEIKILKKVMSGLGRGYLALEYTIPRMGKRIDSVIICDGYIFLIEFKVFETSYKKYAVDQVVDYALDLHNFHERSHAATLFPVLVSTRAEDLDNCILIRGNIASPICCNSSTLLRELEKTMRSVPASNSVNALEWINSLYKPTPTIIEAAQALYSGHDVREISHKESEDNDIEATTNCINHIIEESKKGNWKAICFVTGVPGAGKTLVGLNIANSRHRFKQGDEEHAVFLSGNEPLVTVLREALTREQNEKRKERCLDCRMQNAAQTCDGCEFNVKKSEIFAETKSFIQMIHWFRDDSLLEGHPAPIDRIAIFDEAQRAWKREQLSKFMRTKKGQPNFAMSEPECLIEYMNRHKGWATIVCLVGGGQEIHDGEAGISEWFHALNNSFLCWHCIRRDAGIGSTAAAEAVKVAVGLKGCRRQVRIGEIRLIVIDGDIWASGIVWNRIQRIGISRRAGRQDQAYRQKQRQQRADRFFHRV